MSELRERISFATQELYLREGIEGVSMRKVAELVGVSAPAIYRHFDNKDALLNEIVVAGLRVLEGYLEPALDAPTPIERLRRLTDGYLSFAFEQPKFFDFAFLVPDRRIATLGDEVARPDWATFRLAIEQVGACVDQGLFAPGDPIELAITVWAQAHGLISLYRIGRFGQDAEMFRHVYRRAIERVLDGLAPRSVGGVDPRQ